MIRAALIALLLMIGSQAGADDAELNPDEWTFLECKHADGALHPKLVKEKYAVPSRLMAVKNDESSVIGMGYDNHYDDCRSVNHDVLACYRGETELFSLNRYTGYLYDNELLQYLCKKLDGPLF